MLMKHAIPTILLLAALVGFDIPTVEEAGAEKPGRQQNAPPGVPNLTPMTINASRQMENRNMMEPRETLV